LFYVFYRIEMNTTIVKLEPGIEEEPGSNKRKRETGSRDEPGVKKDGKSAEKSTGSG
jgi:hypothetical protein